MPSSGHETSVAVRTTRYDRLEAPYATNCTMKYPNEYLLFTRVNAEYTVEIMFE